jgi:long-subunit fatty acid transport protein
MKANLRFSWAAAILAAGLLSTPVLGQNQFDALRFSTTNPSNDPATMAMGGASVTNFAGFGSFTQNPATAAMVGRSSFSLGMSTRDVREDTRYLNALSSFNDSQTAISHLGYVYRFPTLVGSLVVGGGYAQIADFNRASSVNAFNDQHSIVDFFLRDPGDQFFTTAFNAFAIEYDDVFDEYFNVLRADGNFRGMNQYAELTERGQLGEYSMFMGTEFLENLFVGASIGITAGDYRYKRTFAEEDLLNRYAGASYDLDVLLVEDRINASLRGLSARIGAVYQPLPVLRIGASFATATKFEIEETYSTFIQTDYKTLDADGFNRYDDTYRGEFTYNVRKPSVLSLGVGLNLPDVVEFETSIERVNYSRIEFEGLGVLRDRDENRAMRSDFKDVYNLRIGAAFHVSDAFIPRVGFAMNPSPRKNFDASVNYLSAGASLKLGNDIGLDFGVQYAFFDDRLDLYRYSNTGVAVATQQVNKVQGMIGLNFAF